MEVALIMGYVALLSIGLLLVGLAFSLAKDLATQTAIAPLARWCIAIGAYLAATSSLVILLVPGIVPWRNYSPGDDGNRLVIALGGGVLALLAIGLAKLGSRSRNAT